jgi:SM-20-related protein
VDTGRGLALDQHDEIAAVKRSRSWRVTAPLRRAGQRIGRPGPRTHTLDLRPLLSGRLEHDPCSWGVIDEVFSNAVGRMLTDSYPLDHYQTVSATGGEKDYSYDVRELIPFGKAAVSHSGELSAAWRGLADDLLSPRYRAAVSMLSGVDLRHAPLEVNVFQYDSGGSIGPHRDLPDKLVTHVLYFNHTWDPANGGCLRVLRSESSSDVAAEVQPVVGSSVVLVRGPGSWHEVTSVAAGAASSRLAVTATFHRPGSASSMWPAGEVAELHDRPGATRA